MSISVVISNCHAFEGYSCILYTETMGSDNNILVLIFLMQLLCRLEENEQARGSNITASLSFALRDCRVLVVAGAEAEVVEAAFRPAAKGKATQETTQEKIVMLLQKNPHMTRNELAASIGITPDGIKYHLEKLSKAKRIQHHGPTKKGSWQILQKE